MRSAKEKGQTRSQKEKGQSMVYKTILRRLKTEQREPLDTVGSPEG